MFKVLLVEDEDMIRRGIRYSIDWLQCDCIVIDEASNGQEGLHKICELEPDIVITDITMPIMDGISMVREALKQHTFSSIIISGYNEFHLAKQAIQLGVSEYLLKPLEEIQLITALESAKSKVVLMRKYEHITNQTDDDKVLLNKQFLEQDTKTSKYVTKMIRYIQAHYADKISIHEMVEELGVSAYYLNHKFKEETSYTFNDFLNRYRIHKAMDLLKNSEVKISNIAHELGFSDYKYFISIFKKYANCTPSQYQEHVGAKKS